MKNKIIIFSVILVSVFFLSFFWLGKKDADLSYDMDSSEKIARDWIEKKASTYLFDGFDLELQESRALDDCPFCYEFIYSFFSRSAGYGDRKDQMTAQVITSHIIKIKIENGVVTEGITDGIFLETENRMLQEEAAKTEEEFLEIEVYFGKTGEEEVFSLKRIIPKTEGVARAAIEELLAGPTSTEKEEGYFSSINPGVSVQEITIKDGVAKIDFSSKLEEKVAGSARVGAIRLQIEKTLKQFETVEEVIISIDGRTEDILQP